MGGGTDSHIVNKGLGEVILKPGHVIVLFYYIAVVNLW
jgi:hypothetical protein